MIFISANNPYASSASGEWQIQVSLRHIGRRHSLEIGHSGFIWLC